MWYQKDANGDWKLQTEYDWPGATVRMLLCDGMTKTTAAILEPRIKSVIDIHEKAGGAKGKLYWSDRLDVPSAEAMPISDLGRLIEANPELLIELYKVLNIQRRPMYVPGKDFDQQLLEAQAVEDEKHRNTAQMARIDAMAKEQT